jgi:hypothetical protein
MYIQRGTDACVHLIVSTSGNHVAGWPYHCAIVVAEVYLEVLVQPAKGIVVRGKQHIMVVGVCIGVGGI